MKQFRGTKYNILRRKGITMKVTATFTETIVVQKNVVIDVKKNDTADHINTLIRDKAYADPVYKKMEDAGWELIETLNVEVDCPALAGRD